MSSNMTWSYILTINYHSSHVDYQTVKAWDTQISNFHNKAWKSQIPPPSYKTIQDKVNVTRDFL